MKNELLIEVKIKKDCLVIPDALIEEVIDNVLKSYKNLNNIKDSDKKVLVKEIRAKLRRSTGMFQKGITEKKRKKLESTDVEEMLKTHISTAERLGDYTLIKEKISALKIKSILDLGCGLNPLALASKNVDYHAYDIRQDEISILNDFFTKEKISGKAEIYDIRKYNKDLPSADLILIWKVLEIVGGDTHALSRKLIQSLKYKYLMISFSTCTLSGKKMLHKKRIWLEKIIKEENKNYEAFQTSSEIFYLINNLD